LPQRSSGVVTPCSNFPIDERFEIAELARMASDALRVKDLHAELGISKGHASEILRGETAPSQKLALRIFRRFGVKLGPLAHATAGEIKALEQLAAKQEAQ
jgi:transcriptional regulator with XRE-family HTH domain